MKRMGMTLFALLLTITPVRGGEKAPVKLTPTDKCPVCGMFVAKYSDFAAQIVFKDGSYAVFDGVKDMFKYYFNLEKYNPAKTAADIDSIYVSDYYDLVLIDGFKAYFVAGSNVYGPMGRELIPFETEEDANEFMIDHVGKSLVKFDEVTRDMIRALE